jgi:TonB family protein
MWSVVLTGARSWLILRPNRALRLCSTGFVRQFTDRERPVVVPQSKPLRSGKILSAFARDSSPETSSSRSGNLDESAALSSLKELIAAGGHRLDPILATITDAARQLTGASGAALVMWKEGAMVCRARSGDTAPALGAQLGAETGISGKCLRTGKIQHCADTKNDPLVDVEVCRSLGLRSIAVLPIQGRREINGILEVFSTQPAAFSKQHLALLQQLAELAERARASQPHGASSAAPKLPVATPQPSSPLPASDRVRNVALAFLGTRSRPFALGAIGLVVISLLALVIWLGWRGPDKADGKAHAAKPSSEGTTTVNAATAHSPDKHPPDNDPLWKANPGGGKTSAGTPVKFASKVDVVSGKKTPTGVAADVVVKYGLPDSQTGSKTGSDSDSRSNLHSDATTSVDPLSIPESVEGQSPLSGVLTAKASLPGLGVPVSHGVSGGQLVHRVPPVYPAQARLLRLEGKVVLAAVIMEDGTLSDVRVIEGEPLLAQSAVDAVQHWRYKPYELDGKPVKNLIRINVDFKFPESSH